MFFRLFIPEQNREKTKMLLITSIKDRQTQSPVPGVQKRVSKQESSASYQSGQVKISNCFFSCTQIKGKTKGKGCVRGRSKKVLKWEGKKIVF